MKRATDLLAVVSFNELISIHALVKRATASNASASSLSSDFNPRPREEGDAVTKDNDGALGDFNPRPREEGDWYNYTRQEVDVDFNPRPREEGDITG